MLLLVYRSLITVILLLLVVGIEVQVSRGIIAFLGHHEIIGLTTFAVNLLIPLGIAAGTDYGIFFVGRYQEARQAGEDRETAYYTTYRGVTKVVLASGLTIAGAFFCLSFTRLPSFQALGVPCAVGIAVAVAVAVTLVPAVLTVGGRFGLFEPKRKIKVRGWRRIGTAIVRWPAPILVATLAVALVGLLTLPGYNPSYNDQKYIPKNIPANLGYEAAARHFPQSANDVARDPVGRGRSRSAQSGRFSGIEQTGQGRPRCSGHFQGAGRHSARGNPDRPHDDTVYAQHATSCPATIHAFSERAHERHAPAGRRCWGKRSKSCSACMA